MLYTDNKNTRLMFEMYSQLRQYYLEIADDDSHTCLNWKMLFLIYRTPSSIVSFISFYQHCIEIWAQTLAELAVI